jgi:uncharacterized protein YgiM (DUF1202 family)
MSIEERIFNFALRFVLGCIVLAILTSCSPFDGLQIATGTPAPTVTATATQSEVTTPSPVETCRVATGYPNGRLNFRSGPGTSYAVLHTVNEGEVLTVTERGDWLNVTDRNGARGYVHSHYCKVKP